jgi:hypothetical protein
MLRNTKPTMGDKAMRRYGIRTCKSLTFALTIVTLGACASQNRVVVSAPPTTVPASVAGTASVPVPGVTSDSVASSIPLPPAPPASMEIKKLQNKNQKKSAIGQLCWALQEANIVGGEVGLEALRTLPPQANGAKPVLPGLPGAAVAAKFRPLAAEIRKIDFAALPAEVAVYGRFFAGRVDTLLDKSVGRDAVSQVDLFAEFFNYDTYPNRAEAESAMRKSADCDFS